MVAPMFDCIERIEQDQVIFDGMFDCMAQM